MCWCSLNFQMYCSQHRIYVLQNCKIQLKVVAFRKIGPCSRQNATNQIVLKNVFLSISLVCGSEIPRFCNSARLSKIFLWKEGRLSGFWHISGVGNQILLYSGGEPFDCLPRLVFPTLISWIISRKFSPFFILSTARISGPISINSSSCGDRNWKTATCFFFVKVIAW